MISSLARLSMTGHPSRPPLLPTKGHRNARSATRAYASRVHLSMSAFRTFTPSTDTPIGGFTEAYAPYSEALGVPTEAWGAGGLLNGVGRTV